MQNTKHIFLQELSQHAELNSEPRLYLESIGVTPFYDKIKGISSYFMQNIDIETHDQCLTKSITTEDEMYIRHGYLASLYSIDSLNLFVKESCILYRLCEIIIYERELVNGRTFIYNRADYIQHFNLLCNSFYLDYSAFLLLFNDVYFYFVLAQTLLLKDVTTNKIFNLTFANQRQPLPEFYYAENRYFYDEKYFNLKPADDMYSGKRNIDYADISVNYLTNFWAKYRALNKLVEIKVPDYVCRIFSKFSTQVLNHN